MNDKLSDWQKQADASHERLNAFVEEIKEKQEEDDISDFSSDYDRRASYFNKRIPYETSKFKDQVQGGIRHRIAQRVINCLKGAGIMTYGDLMSRTEKDLLMIPRFGILCLWAIEQHLDKLQLSLKK